MKNLEVNSPAPKGEFYNQDFDEWVMLLKGKAELFFPEKKEKITLLEGDYIYIKANNKHRVEYTSNDAIWIALHLKE